MSDTDESYSGPQFTSGRGSEWPTNFGDWPRKQQRDYVSGYLLRRDIIRRILLIARADVPDRIAADHRLDTKQLASIYLAIKEANQ